MTDRAIIVRLTDETELEVHGASWTEPPMFLPAGGWTIPGVLQDTECEVSREQAQEIRRELEPLLKAGKPLVIGRGWRWTPLDADSSFIVIRDSQAEKVASFHPDEVAAVYFKGTAEVVSD